jgi:hypothetical protein
MSKIKEALSKLAGLYEMTGVDWCLDVKWIITESPYPTASIYPEGWLISRYRCCASDMEAAICGVSERVYREIVAREPVQIFEFYSSLNDECYAEWIKARMAGSDDKLPEEKW